MTRKLTYLATPYSHGSIAMRFRRFNVANRVAAELIKSGELIFSPISHTHHMALLHDLPADWEFWEQHCRVYLNASHKLIVLQQDGWMESVGVQAEIKLAEELQLTIEHMEVPAWDGRTW